MKVLSLWHGEIDRPAPRRSMRSIIEAISALSGLPVDVLRGPGRFRDVVYPRQEAMRQMRAAGHSLTAIGRFCGGRDHTTVLYGSLRAAERLAMLEAA